MSRQVVDSAQAVENCKKIEQNSDAKIVFKVITVNSLITPDSPLCDICAKSIAIPDTLEYYSSAAQKNGGAAECC